MGKHFNTARPGEAAGSAGRRTGADRPLSGPTRPAGRVSSDLRPARPGSGVGAADDG